MNKNTDMAKRKESSKNLSLKKSRQHARRESAAAGDPCLNMPDAGRRRSASRLNGSDRQRRISRPERGDRNSSVEADELRRSEEKLRRKSSIRARKRKRRVRVFRLIISAAVAAAVILEFGVPYAKRVSLERAGAPESLIRLAERRPETYSFVRDYQKYADAEFDIDISAEVASSDIPQFYQWDKRWGYQRYGSDCMAITGCGPTSLSMVYCGLTKDIGWNPLRMAQWAEENGYYVNGAGSAWSLMGEGAQRLGLNSEEAYPDADTIISRLSDGKVIIGIMGPGEFTDEGHFIVLRGLSQDGKVKVNDPNSKEHSKKLWDVDNLVSQMQEMWIYG